MSYPLTQFFSTTVSSSAYYRYCSFASIFSPNIVPQSVLCSKVVNVPWAWKSCAKLPPLPMPSSLLFLYQEKMLTRGGLLTSFLKLPRTSSCSLHHWFLLFLLFRIALWLFEGDNHFPGGCFLLQVGYLIFYAILYPIKFSFSHSYGCSFLSELRSVKFSL